MIEHVLAFVLLWLQIKPIPMPPPFRDGLFIEGDIPLTKPRHDLIVLQLAQVRT